MSAWCEGVDGKDFLGVTLLTCINNYIHHSVWLNYVSIPKLQRLHRWSLGMDKWFNPTLSCVHNYLSMLGLKLNSVIIASGSSSFWAHWYFQIWKPSDLKNCSNQSHWFTEIINTTTTKQKESTTKNDTCLRQILQIINRFSFVCLFCLFCLFVLFVSVCLICCFFVREGIRNNKYRTLVFFINEF